MKGLRYPISVEIEDETALTVATFALAVSLGEDDRGTHMSRFVEQVVRLNPLSPSTADGIVRELALRLASKDATFEATFPFFLERRAPVSGAEALVDYEGFIRAVLEDDATRVTIGAKVPVTSLCPCSKEISDYGAHSQRGYVSIEATLADTRLGLAELVAIAEGAASAPIFALLKRSDERYVTMSAYDRPAFVEDLARAVAAELIANERIAEFSVDVENQESIHNHAAWARIG